MTQIEYGTRGWGVVSGCLHGPDDCAISERCWARGMAHRFGQPFEPMFHPERLEEPLHYRGSQHVLVCFTGDLGGWWVDTCWQQAVVDIIRRCPQHTFYLLTKNPMWYTQPMFIPWPENAWLGTSITGFESMEVQDERVSALLNARVRGGHAWLSLEPLMGSVERNVRVGIEWVTVGGFSGCHSMSPEQAEWLYAVERESQPWLIPIWLKSNLFAKGVAIPPGWQRRPKELNRD